MSETVKQYCTRCRKETMASPVRLGDWDKPGDADPYRYTALGGPNGSPMPREYFDPHYRSTPQVSVQT